MNLKLVANGILRWTGVQIRRKEWNSTTFQNLKYGFNWSLHHSPPMTMLSRLNFHRPVGYLSRRNAILMTDRSKEAYAYFKVYLLCKYYFKIYLTTPLNLNLVLKFQRYWILFLLWTTFKIRNIVTCNFSFPENKYSNVKIINLKISFV